MAGTVPWRTCPQQTQPNCPFCFCPAVPAPLPASSHPFGAREGPWLLSLGAGSPLRRGPRLLSSWLLKSSLKERGPPPQWLERASLFPKRGARARDADSRLPSLGAAGRTAGSISTAGGAPITVGPGSGLLGRPSAVLGRRERCTVMGGDPTSTATALAAGAGRPAWLAAAAAAQTPGPRDHPSGSPAAAGLDPLRREAFGVRPGEAVPGDGRATALPRSLETGWARTGQVH